jgi:hypothetical protein
MNTWIASAKNKKVIVLACGLSSYGPLVQGLMLTAEIIEICNEESIDLEIVSSSHFKCMFANYYSCSNQSHMHFSSNLIDKIFFSSLLGRLLFSSLIFPVLRPNCSLFYLDDTGCILPSRHCATFIHSPISVFDYPQLKQSRVSISRLRHFLQKLYLLWIAHAVRTSFVVQSDFVASSLANQLFIRPSSVTVVNVESMSRKWHPLLGANVHYNSIDIGTSRANNVACLIDLEIERIFECGFKKIVFCCCSPRLHKNPWHIYQVAQQLPSIAFVCTLSSKFFDESEVLSNLFPIGPVTHEHALGWISHEAVHLTFFPSLMETYGLPIVESALLKKHCVIPSMNFFEVHASPYVVRYKAGDTDSAVNLILALCS